MMRINIMRKNELIDELKELNLSTSGKVADMRKRLKNALTEKAKPTNETYNADSVQNQLETMSYIDNKIDKKFQEIINLLSNQQKQQTQQKGGADRSAQREGEQNTQADFDDAHSTPFNRRHTRPQHNGPVNERKTTHFNLSRPHERDESIDRMPILSQDAWFDMAANQQRNERCCDRNGRDGDRRQHAVPNVCLHKQAFPRNRNETLVLSDDEEQAAAVAHTTVRRQNRANGSNQQTNQFGAFTFRDIEHALNTFGGKDSYRIETWTDEFEEYAQMFNWNEMQKLFYAE